MPKNLPARHPRLRYHLAERFIESHIREHHLQPGDPIPSVSVLTEKLGINGVTAQRAIRNLVQRRMLRTVQGKGTFVGDGAVRRLLWVSGVDLMHGDTSPYYGKLLRAAERICAEKKRMLVPVWLPPAAPFEPVLDANGGENTIEGYFFSGCREDHHLYRYIRSAGKPYVNLSVSHKRPSYSCRPRVAQAHELALTHLRDRGHQSVRVFHLGSAMLPTAGSLGLDLRSSSIEWVEASPVQAETEGYLAARKLIDEGGLERAHYITDDIAARGVTRAILERSRNPADFDIVVLGIKGLQVPLGMPVTYVAYDVDEQMRRALEIIETQERGPVTDLLCEWVPFTLIPPGEAT